MPRGLTCWTAAAALALLAACASPTHTLRLSITANPDVGALTALTARVLVGTGDDARVASLDIDLGGARRLDAEPYVLQIDVPEGHRSRPPRGCSSRVARAPLCAAPGSASTI